MRYLPLHRRWLDRCRAILAAAFVALTGCAHYQARPIDPAATAAQWQARRLDDPALAARLAPALREAWPPARYGRGELLLAALVLNPDLAEARAHLAEADAAVRTAKALPNPSVNLALERYTQDQAGSSPWLWGVSTNWLIDTAVRRRLRADLADAGVRAARLDYAEKVWDVRRNLRAALADVLLGDRQHALADDAVTKATALQAAQEHRRALGEAMPADVLQVALVLAQARDASAAAAQRVADARARLARAVGVPVHALDGVALAWDDLESPPDPPAARLGELAAQARLSRPDLERALVDYASRETELRQQVRMQYPQISIGPGYTYDHGVRKLQFSLGATLPLFDQNQGPIAEAEARREVAGRHIETVQASIDSEIDGAAARLAAARQALDAAAHGHAAAARLQQQTATGYAHGEDDRIAVLNAQLAAVTAAQAQLTAAGQAQQALGALEDAVRTPLEGNEAELLRAAGHAGDSP
ncbi:TolC family protein [Dyella sp. 2RAB6]|uniref:TolC family protein n=1 Tax=Dyella sp. 2RAB6 TaxID=3232992 RepID=UPI003F92D7FB